MDELTHSSIIYYNDNFINNNNNTHNRLKDHLESTVLAANSKGRLYVAILGGSDLGPYHFILIS